MNLEKYQKMKKINRDDISRIMLVVVGLILINIILSYIKVEYYPAILFGIFGIPILSEKKSDAVCLILILLGLGSFIYFDIDLGILSIIIVILAYTNLPLLILLCYLFKNKSIKEPKLDKEKTVTTLILEKSYKIFEYTYVGGLYLFSCYFLRNQFLLMGFFFFIYIPLAVFIFSGLYKVIKNKEGLEKIGLPIVYSLVSFLVYFFLSTTPWTVRLIHPVLVHKLEKEAKAKTNKDYRVTGIYYRMTPYRAVGGDYDESQLERVVTGYTVGDKNGGLVTIENGKVIDHHNANEYFDKVSAYYKEQLKGITDREFYLRAYLSKQIPNKDEREDYWSDKPYVNDRNNKDIYEIMIVIKINDKTMKDHSEKNEKEEQEIFYKAVKKICEINKDTQNEDLNLEVKLKILPRDKDTQGIFYCLWPSDFEKVFMSKNYDELGKNVREILK